MSNLGLNSKVKEKFAKMTVEDEAVVIGNLGIKDELELLNKTYKSILVIIYNKLSKDEKDKVKSFDELLERVDNISDDDKWCMADLKRVLNKFFYEPNCNSFKDFVNKQKEISDLIEKLE